MALIIDKQVENQMAVLQAVSTADGELGKRLRESIFQEMKAARNRIVSDLHFKNGDPRGTAHSVKRYVATRYLGGVISIRKPATSSGGQQTYEAPRTLQPGKRGGNRMIRGKETQRYLSYGPQDRWMILMWLNNGTNPRYGGGGRTELRGSLARNFFRMQEEGENYRGSISPRNFFGTIGVSAVQTAMNNLGRIIDEEYNKVFIQV